MTKYGNLAPEFSLLTRTRQASMKDFLPRYGRKCDFGPICPNMEIRAQTPKKMTFSDLFYFFLRSLQILLLTSPQPASVKDFLPRYGRKCDFGPICPNMEKQGNFAPDPLKIAFFRFFGYFQKDLQISLLKSPQ